MPSEPFAEVVMNKLEFLLSEHGFRMTEASEYVVLLENPTLCVEAAWDPRGEVAVSIFRRGRRNAGKWSYNGMVGRASVERLLELAGEAMRAEAGVLDASTRFYERLAAEQRKNSVEWTAYYSGMGPHPGRSGKLP
jgi:hypothetical protein